MSTVTTAGRGRVVASVNDATVERSLSPIDNTPVVYCHSAAASPYEAVAASPLPAVRGILTRLARWGFNTIAPTVAPLYGASLEPIENALTYHRASMGGTSAAPVIIGVSAGAPAAIRYGMGDGAEAASCIVLFIPAIDLDGLYEGNIGGLRAAIGGAWGVTHPTPLPGTADLLARASELTIPCYMVVASDDVVSTNFASFASAAADVTVDNVGALGHTDAALEAADIDAIMEFIQGAA